MSTFAVDTAQVASTSNNVRRSIDSIRAEVNTMMANLRALQSSWTGEAAAQFADVAAQWHATQGQVEQSLESIKQSLDATASHYAEAEANIRGMFRRFSVQKTRKRVGAQKSTVWATTLCVRGSKP
jgi:WXG100 family type VII secretion target